MYDIYTRYSTVEERGRKHLGPGNSAEEGEIPNWAKGEGIVNMEQQLQKHLISARADLFVTESRNFLYEEFEFSTQQVPTYI